MHLRGCNRLRSISCASERLSIGSGLLVVHLRGCNRLRSISCASERL